LRPVLKFITDKNSLLKQNGPFCNIAHQKSYFTRHQK
jgi:hypothetical protein